MTNMYQISMNILFEPVIVTALVNTFPPGLFLFLSVLTPYSFETAGSLENRKEVSGIKLRTYKQIEHRHNPKAFINPSLYNLAMDGV